MSSVLISRNGGAQTRIGGAQTAKESLDSIYDPKKKKKKKSAE